MTALLLAGAFAIILAAAWALQRKLIYLPARYVPNPPSVGLAAAQPVSFLTSDNIRLNAWFIPATPPGRITMLVFNGNAGNRAMRAGLARAFARRGFGILLLDYRGFGGNAGDPSERGLTADALAARRYVASRPDMDQDRLVYFGESLGAAVALRLADEFPPAAVILRSPFSSLAAIAAIHYPWVPARWLLRDRFAGIDLVGRLRSPLLVIAGDRDTIVPLADSRRLFDAAHEPKQFVTVAGADHNDPALAEGPVMIDAVVTFLKTYSSP